MKHLRAGFFAAILTGIIAGPGYASGPGVSSGFLAETFDHGEFTAGAFITIPFGGDRKSAKQERFQYGLRAGYMDARGRGSADFVSLRFNPTGYAGLAVAGRRLSYGKLSAAEEGDKSDNNRDKLEIGVAIGLAAALVAYNVALNDDKN